MLAVATGILLGVGLLLLGAVAFLYGGRGEPYPDLTGPPLIPEHQIEVAVESERPVGNVAVSQDGRVFYTIHPESRPEGPVLWVHEEGESRPFLPEGRQAELFETPLGVVVDRQGRLWTIDHGNHGFGRPRLLAFDLQTREVVFDLSFASGAAPLGSFVQDLQIDPEGETAYIADVGFLSRSSALVVVDLEDRTARRVLEEHPSVTAQEWLVRNPIREMVFLGGLVGFHVGVDGLALGRNGEWLAYGAMTHDTLFRVPTAALQDSGLPGDRLAAKVEAIGPKPLNDGLSTDIAGNVLVTDVEHGAVVRISPAGELETLVRSDRIRWPDALSYGPGGWLYVADSAIPHLMLRSKEHIRGQAPYRIFRFHPGIPGISGQ